MMDEKNCPDYWKVAPERIKASENMMFCLVFESNRWRSLRTPWVRRCNASGKYIWPFQKAWHGYMAIRHNIARSDHGRGGSFADVWLTDKSYIMEKLKSNI